MKDEINAAILAHGQWKARLISTIESGKSDFTPEKVGVDNLCDFGKWFHSLVGADTTSENYKEVLDLHAEFHKAAAKVLALGLAGKKKEAQDAMDVGSEYSNISSSLILALGRWRNSVIE